MTAKEALDALFSLLYNSSKNYEDLATGVHELRVAQDRDWITSTLKNLYRIGLSLNSETDTEIKAMGKLAVDVVTQSVVDVTALRYGLLNDFEPLSCVTDTDTLPTWSGATYLNSTLKIVDHRVKLSNGVTSSSKALLNYINLYYSKYSILDVVDYEAKVTFPALVELASDEKEAINQAMLNAQEDGIKDDIIARRTVSLGKRPEYSVTADDTLESVAQFIYSDSSQTDKLIRSLGLYPPYIAKVPTSGCMWPGYRIILPSDDKFVSEVENFGYTWALEQTPGDGYMAWDIDLDGEDQLVELSGEEALGTELAIRITQPIGDWLDSDQPGIKNYGVVSEYIGTSTIDALSGANFAISQSLLNDPRVASATPRALSTQEEGRIIIRDIMVTPNRRPSSD